MQRIFLNPSPPYFFHQVQIEDMLLKVKYLSVKKYIRLHAGFTYLEFISEGKISLEIEQYAAHVLANEITKLYVVQLFCAILTVNIAHWNVSRINDSSYWNHKP